MAKLNRNYCKPDADMKPVFAPVAFRYNGKDYWHPEKEDFALVGYPPLSPDWPVDPPEGKHYERTDKIEANGADGYKWVYVLVDDPPPPLPVYDRYKLVCALEEAGLLQDFMEILKTDPVLEFKWVSAKQLDYDDNVLETGIAALKTALGVTDEQIAAILAKCVKEGA